MAKRKPVFSLQDMEKALGYEIDFPIDSTDTSRWFYSDLRPVTDDIHERTQRELDEREKLMHNTHDQAIPQTELLRLDEVKVLEFGDDTTTVVRKTNICFYSFLVNIHYGFGLNLSLLFTQHEVFHTLAVSKIRSSGIRGKTAAFFHLPREVRDKIYSFALPHGEWKIGDVEDFDRVTFPKSIGDLTGFYFPLAKNLSLLRVSRQMRQEGLPLAYRKTAFQFDDIDDLIKLLVAVGRTGLDNIESLEFPWESRSDMEGRWDKVPNHQDHISTLPTLHVSECVQLLRQCKRLKFLRLYFETELISKMPLETFMADGGISELSSIQGVQTVEVRSLGHKPLDDCSSAKWLKEKIEGSSKDNGGINTPERSSVCHGSAAK